MNLAEFLASQSQEPLNTLALYMSAELKDTLLAYQDTLGPVQHRVEPVELADGRWILCADVLTEIGEHGIFKRGFEILPQELFALVTVDVMPTHEQMKQYEDETM